MIEHNAQQRPVVVHLRRVAAEEGMPEKYGIKITYIDTQETAEEIVPEVNSTGACLALLKYGNIDNQVMADVTAMVNTLPEAKLHAVRLQTEQAHKLCMELMDKAADPANLTPAEDEELGDIITGLGHDILCIVSRRNKCEEVREEERWEENRLDMVRSIVADVVMNRINGANDGDTGKIALTCYMDSTGVQRKAAEAVMMKHPMLAILALAAMESGMSPEEFGALLAGAEKK